MKRFLILVLFALPLAAVAAKGGGKRKAQAAKGPPPPNELEEAANAAANHAAAQAALALAVAGPSGSGAAEQPNKRSKRLHKQPPSPAKLQAAKPPPPPADSGPDTSDDDFDSELDPLDDTNWDAGQAGPSAPAGTSTAAATLTDYNKAVSALRFQAGQFDDKGQPHLARAATDIATLHGPLAAALRGAGDINVRKAYSETERADKLEELANAVQGALLQLRDRNMDLAIRSAARDMGVSELDVLKTTRAQYGTQHDLDPELRVAMRDAIKLAASNSHKKHHHYKHSATSRTFGHGMGPRSHTNYYRNNNRNQHTSYPHNSYNSYNSYNRRPSPPRNKNPGRYSCNGYDFKPFNNNNDRSGGPGGFNPGSSRPYDYRAPQHGSAYANRGQQQRTA